MADELKHVGVKGMHWGVRKKEETHNEQVARTGKGTFKPTLNANGYKKQKAGDFVKDQRDVFEKILNAYSVKKKPNGHWNVGLSAYFKIAATVWGAKFLGKTIKTIAQTESYLIRTGRGPKIIGDLAWTFGKIKENNPLR